MMTNSKLENKKRLLHYSSVLTCTLAAISSGLHLGWSSPSLPTLLGEDTPLPITTAQSSWVDIIYLIGAPCGAIFTGLILDIFGRKPVLLFSSVPLFASWMMIAFASTLPELLLGRFVAGFAEGLVFVAAPIYLTEISDSGIRGFLGSVVTISYLLGTLLYNILGWYMSIKYAALLCSSVPLVCVLTSTWMLETPSYLLMRGKKEQARRTLIVLTCSKNVDVHLEAMSNAMDAEDDALLRCFNLFTKTNGRRMLLAMGLRGAQQLSGFVAITFYAQTVFEETGGLFSPFLCVVVFYCVQITFSGLSSVFVDKLGRRPLLMASVTGCCMTLFVEGVYFALREVGCIEMTAFSWLPIVGLIVFIISFNVGLQTIPIFMVAEIFPTNVKAYATALTYIYFCALSGITSIIFNWTKDEYGIFVPFFTFSVCCMFVLLFIVSYVPETKTKTLDEIQIELSRK